MEIAKRWFDDFTVGEVFEIGPHLMTEARMIEFASEFDPQPFHTDPAADSIYGGLIASGWHTGSVLMKLLATTLGPSSLGSPGCDELRWVAPVRPDDRLTLRVTVVDKRPSTTRQDRGILIYGHEMIDQDGLVVMTMQSTMFMRRRPAG